MKGLPGMQDKCGPIQTERDTVSHMGYNEFTIEGRNAVLEALRAGRPVDKLFILDGCKDGPVMSIRREASKRSCMVKYVDKERLDQISETGKHQGVIAYVAAYAYVEVEDILEKAREREEAPYPDCQPGGGAWRHYSQKPRGGPDGHCGEGLCGGNQLHAGGEGDESGTDH